jgi:hypothetical protein
VPSNLPINGHSFRRVEVRTGTARRRSHAQWPPQLIVFDFAIPTLTIFARWSAFNWLLVCAVDGFGGLAYTCCHD